MTVKQFFKSTAFKCIAVLMSVLLVSGVVLAIAWGFLEVTDEERFNRKIGSVYGGDTVTAVEQDLTGKNVKVGDATIDKMWYINEKNDYLVQASSRGNGGDVTCWIAVSMNEDKKTVKGISKVLLYDVADKAEYVGYIGSEVYEKFSTDYVDGKVFTYGDQSSSEFIKTNATFSLTAVCNDVNGAVEFVKAYASGGEIVDPFEAFTYKDKINTSKTTWTVSGEEIEYKIVTKANSGPNSFNLTIKVDASKTVTSYEITKNGCVESEEHTEDEYKSMMSAVAKDLTGATLADIEGYLAEDASGEHLHTGATKSNELCFHAAAFALSNYERILQSGQGGNE